MPDGLIFAHLAITLYETFTGFFIGAVCGIGLGFLLGRRETLAQILDPYVVAFNRIRTWPGAVVYYLVRHGPTSKIILVIIVVFFLTFFNTYAGVKGMDAELFLKNILRIMGATNGKF